MTPPTFRHLTDLSEQDTSTKQVIPALVNAGWDINTQIREEVYFTDGRIFVRGRMSARGKAKRADIVLYHIPNVPLAIIEVKSAQHHARTGMQQVLDYAKTLDVPVVFSTNGQEWVRHDRTQSKANGIVERNFSPNEFPTPAELWEKYKIYKGINSESAERIATQSYFYDGSGRAPRYYQQIAINREMDIFDMICHAAFDQPPLSRREGANRLKKRNVFTRYVEKARQVQATLLDKYANEGIENMEDIKILKVNPFDKISTPSEVIELFDGKAQYQNG